MLPSPGAALPNARARHLEMHASVEPRNLAGRLVPLEKFIDLNLPDFRFAVRGQMMEECQPRMVIRNSAADSFRLVATGIS
jgi:hypothetical protein